MLTRLISFFILIPLLLVGMALAQDDNTIATPDGFVIAIPDGYQAQVLEGPTVYIANSDNAMTALENASGDLGTDDIAFTVSTPSSLAELGLAADIAPDLLLEELLAMLGTSSEVTKSWMGVGNEYAAIEYWWTDATGAGSPAPHTSLYAFSIDAGTVLLIGQAGDHVNTIDLSVIMKSLVYEQPTDLIMNDELRQWAISATGTSQYGNDDWSFMQATGAPDTAACGDITTAWAAASATTDEILALEFAQPVIPSQVNIYQTYTPGSIVMVELSNTITGETVTIPESADPPGNTPCPGVFTLNITDIQSPVNGVIIYFDQSIGGNWNEIDAVELVGTPVE